MDHYEVDYQHPEPFTWELNLAEEEAAHRRWHSPWQRFRRWIWLQRYRLGGWIAGNDRWDA